MTYLEAILLSLLQGATEFLPVSSSGHEVLAHGLLYGEQTHEDPLLFVLLVHLGTLLAILWVFRGLIGRFLIYAGVEGWRQWGQSGFAAAWLKNPTGRMILAILLACIPTGLIGVLAKDRIEALFVEPELAGYALCVTALLLAATRLRKNPVTPQDEEATYDISFIHALIIGAIQGGALIPGISRSGSTIAVALILGMNRRLAGEFSFLIAIPAIFGAILLKFRDFDPSRSSMSVGIGLVSMLVSAVSGYFFLRLLLRFVRGGQFSYFAIYCLVVGIWAIIYF
ncbi:MAG: undecaprenyl-diphosphate phosphatase [Candidatus Sumerlaeia bacterium]